jgi:alcohol dehydrogenase class IV
MQLAATMAGWAFTVAQVGLAHGMAHTVGALHHVPHGAACGIVLPKVMRYNVDTSADKLAQVATALGVNIAGMSERDAALAAADAVEALMKKVGHPMRLRDVGVPEESLPICAFHAIADTAVIFNGKPVNDPNDVIQLFQQVF